MDIVESIENTVIMSNLTLKELNDQKETIDKIKNENQKLTQLLSLSEKLINTFYSFYNTLKYKLTAPFSNYFEDTNNTKVNKTLQLKNKKIKVSTSDSLLYNLKSLKENNLIISKELDEQNNDLNLLYLNLEINNQKIKFLKDKL